MSAIDPKPPYRVAVMVQIYSDTLAPEEISARLGLSPTRTAKKGPKTGKFTGRISTVPQHFWHLSSEDRLDSTDLAVHIEWILGQLDSVSAELSRVAETGVTRMDLHGVVWTNGTSAYVTLTPTLLQRLAKRGLSLQLEFADYGDDD